MYLVPGQAGPAAPQALFIYSFIHSLIHHLNQFELAFWVLEMKSPN